MLGLDEAWGQRTYLEAQRQDPWRFGGTWDHILVISGRASRSLLPLTSRVGVQDIARDRI
jgi:hypothetical protein